MPRTQRTHGTIPTMVMNPNKPKGTAQTAGDAFSVF